MAVPYQKLEEMIETSLLQVETMSAIIGCLLGNPKVKATFSAEDLRKNHATFSVVVIPNEDGSITITLREKNDK